MAEAFNQHAVTFVRNKLNKKLFINSISHLTTLARGAISVSDVGALQRTNMYLVHPKLLTIGDALLKVAHQAARASYLLKPSWCMCPYALLELGVTAVGRASQNLLACATTPRAICKDSRNSAWKRLALAAERVSAGVLREICRLPA